MSLAYFATSQANLGGRSSGRGHALAQNGI
jgi:hypothetical protein